jgi:predicted amidophosphoribosyltransferase
MFCAQCGKPIFDQPKFCSYCGAPVDAPAQPANTFEELFWAKAATGASALPPPPPSFFERVKSLFRPSAH